MQKKIYYKAGYKYKLVKQYSVRLDVFPMKMISTDYLQLTVSGWLFISPGYAWDGPSGPAVDTHNFMRGSLTHDALYQLMRKEKLSRRWRKTADQILREMCREDGMGRVRAAWVYGAVRLFGRRAATIDGARPVIISP